MRSDVWLRTLESEVGNSKQKLFGGAQYHRAIKEFTLAVRHMVTPTVTEDEIANAAGIGDRHNGVRHLPRPIAPYIIHCAVVVVVVVATQL